MTGSDLRPIRPFGTPWTLTRMVFDTCIWIAWREPNDPERPAIEELLRLRRDARIEIVKTDTVDTERIEGASNATATDRILETAGIVELHGPAVFDNSRWDHSVFASEEDGERIDDVLAVIFPGTDRHATDRTSKHNLRDAMHVATAIRYGFALFVTTDFRLLRKAAEVQATWNIWILTPTDAVRFVGRLIERERIRAGGHQNRPQSS